MKKFIYLCSMMLLTLNMMAQIDLNDQNWDYNPNVRDTTIWQGPGEMLIDYIRVCQLVWDCSTDEVITCQSDLDGFEYGVKKSVSITSTVNEPVVGSGDNVTFRITDSFEVTGPFIVDNGAGFTVIQQLCPNEE